MLKTPLRYPGGKSKVADYLVSLFPKYKEYREPFLGGGSVFLTALQNNPNASYWVNDLYYDVYCFWSTAYLHPKRLYDRVKAYKEYFKDGKKLYNYILSNIEDDRKNSQEKLAADFFILNRITCYRIGNSKNQRCKT